MDIVSLSHLQTASLPGGYRMPTSLAGRGWGWMGWESHGRNQEQVLEVKIRSGHEACFLLPRITSSPLPTELWKPEGSSGTIRTRGVQAALTCTDLHQMKSHTSEAQTANRFYRERSGGADMKWNIYDPSNTGQPTGKINSGRGRNVFSQ